MSTTKTYVQTLNATIHSLMDADPRIILIGQGVTSPWYVGGTCDGLLDRFGPTRVIDTPISENAVTGAAVGMALTGLRPILVFPRMDFMLYAMDPIINQAAKWSYIFGGKSTGVPLVIWTIINRGGCQGAQHSQDFGWIFDGIPGIDVHFPSRVGEVEKMWADMIKSDSPSVYIDDRDLYTQTDHLVSRPSNNEQSCPAPCSEPLEEVYYDN